MTMNTKNTGLPVLGEIYEGKVKRVLPFGAFVDLGFADDGLVHISEISFQRIEDINAVLKPGDVVKVRVIGFGDNKRPGDRRMASDRQRPEDTKRIRLSIKKATSDYNFQAAEPVFGQVYQGKVVRLIEHGAFVNFGFDRDGMVHISHIAPHRIAKVSDVLSEGDVVSVRFLGFNDKGYKLSIKDADDSRHPQPDTVYQGTVTRIESWGAFVRFCEGHEGMVHISEMVEGGGINHNAHDYVSMDETVDVVFEGYDDRGRIGLSMLKARQLNGDN